MPLTTSRQTRFDAGEATRLQGRTDIEQYSWACFAMDNWFPTRHGSAMTRPGFEFVADLGFKTSFSRPRIFGVEFNADQSVIMLFGYSSFLPGPYLQFYVNGVLTVNAGVATSPFGAFGAQQELRDMKVVQIGSSIIATHPSYEPRLYTFDSLSPLTVNSEVMNFDAKPYAGIEPLLVEPVYTDLTDSTHPAKEWQFYVSTLMRTIGGVTYETAAYKVKQSILFQGGPGPLNNNARSPATSRFTTIEGSSVALAGEPNGYMMQIFPDMPAELDFCRDHFTSAMPIIVRGDDDTIVGSVIYRGRGDVIGRVGRVLGDQLGTLPGGVVSDVSKVGFKTAIAAHAVNATPGRFIDHGADPDLNFQPRNGRNPFKIYNPAIDNTVGIAQLLRLESPSCSCFFQERLVFANTGFRPDWLWLSAAGQFLNFDLYLEPTSESAIEGQLSAIGLEEIRSLVPAQSALFVFTSGGVWTVAGSGGLPISPIGSRQTQQISTVGATTLQPLQLPGGLIYERQMGGGVRDCYFSNEGGGYNTGDLSFLSQHLFEGLRLDAWGYAEVPWGLVWAARQDGKLLSLLYDKARGIVGWNPHTLADGGLALDVAVVAEGGNEHVTYLLTERTVGGSAHYILERSTSRIVGDPALYNGLDASATKVVVAGGSTGTRVTGLNHLNGRSVKINGKGLELGPFTVLAGVVEISNDAIALGDTVIVGLPFTPRLVQMDLEGDATRQKLVQRVSLEVESSRGAFVGADGGTMREWQQRNVDDSYDALTLYTGEVLFHVESTWNKHGRIAIEQRSPYPLTIKAITRHYEVSR